MILEHDSESPPGMDLWIEERHRDQVAMRFRVNKVLFSARSPYQQVEIVETAGLGRMLLNDGLVMISEKDEFIYHEMISHVPLTVHPDPQRVLVIGGGDGGTVREVLRHPSVKSCKLVEIDRMVVDACKEFIPQTSACLDDPRVTVCIEDGVKFVAETDERFDVVLVDSTDPIGPAAPLFGEAFYSNVRRVLSEQGLVVSQAESPYCELPTQASLLGILHKLFPCCHIYNYCNMTYPAGLWSFSFVSKGLCPLANLSVERSRALAEGCRYYSEHVHRAAFALPAFMQRELGDCLTPFAGPEHS